MTTALRRPSRLVAVVTLLAALLVGAQVLQAVAAPPAPRVAFLARADNPVDALAAGAVAAQVGGVVLLTTTARLEAPAAAGLASYKPDLVILAGGTAALSEQVEADLTALGYTHERVGGTTRLETAQLLSERLATLDHAWLRVEGTASNSEKLQGRPASGITRAASFETGQTLTQPGGPAGMIIPAASVKITAPTPGWLIIDAGSDMRRPAGEALVGCGLRVGAENVTGSGRQVRLTGAPGHGFCQTSGRFQVASGEHTVTLLAATAADQGVEFRSRSVVVQFVPFDGSGAGLAPDQIGP
jgi:hypothetical protein